MSDEIPIAYLDPRLQIVDKTGRPTREFMLAFNDLIRRVGGQQTNAVAAAASVAASAQATGNAASAGITIPAPGGAVELTPSDVITVVNASRLLAQISVATHTRTGAAAPVSPSTINVARPNPGESDVAYFVFYNDPANAGGAVTTEVTASTGDINESGGDRVIGVASVSASPPLGGSGGGLEP